MTTRIRSTSFDRTSFLLLVLVASVAGCGSPDTGGDETRDRAEATGEAAAGNATLADSLVGAWIEAAGGMEGWRSVRTARYTVNTVLYDSTGAVEWMRPRRVELRKTERGEESRIERPESEGLYVQVFNGDTAWATLNGRPLPPDHPAAEETEYVGRDVFYWFGLPFKLKDPGVDLEASEARDGYEVRVSFGEGIGAHPGDRYYYYFLDEDPFPEEVHYIEQGSENRSRTLWSDFTEAGPVVYVGNRRWVNEDGVPTKELRIDDVWIDPELADSLFRAP